MPRDLSFWHNWAIVGAVHAVVLFGLARWSGSAKKPSATDIVWMDAGPAAAAAESAPIELPATPEEVQPNVVEDNPAPADSPAEIALPPPSPTPPALPSTTPTPKPAATAKPSPKPTPRKALLAKAAPTASPKPRASPRLAKIDAPKKVAAVTPPENPPSSGGDTSVGNASAGGRGSGAGAASQFGWYGEMLHKRFFSEWVQPTSVGMKGAKMSTGVRVRIEKDGRVSDFALVRPSGNVVVDESVAAVAKRVLRVDPPPFATVKDHYDVNINFELDPQ